MKVTTELERKLIQYLRTLITAIFCSPMNEIPDLVKEIETFLNEVDNGSNGKN